MNSGSAPRPALFSAVLLAVALCLGALLRCYGPQFLGACFLPIPIFELTGLSALAAGLSGAVFLHEMGHLLAALANDFEVSGVVLGPLRFVRLGDSWTLTLKQHRLFEASVSAFPKTEENWRRRMIVVVAAGPLATFLTGLASMFLLHAFAGESNWFIWSLRAFAQVSFFLFVLGLVPNHKSSPCQNDAALLSSLWRMDPQANETFLYHLVLQQQRRGVRPQSYPRNLMGRLMQFQGRPDFMAFFAATIASWAFDNNDPDTGNDWNNRALALCSNCHSYSRHLAMVNSACFDIIYQKDLTAARAKLDKLDTNAILLPYLRHRARAAVHLTTNQIPEALAEIAAARSALPKHLQNSGVEYLLLGHLHAAALTMRPADLSARVQQWKVASPRRTSLAVI